VTISYAPSALSLTVSDDGCGFVDGHVVGLDGHYGIVSMRERAASIGADLHLDSQPGHGTQVSIDLPFGGKVRKIAV
jgi:signal transduction histidine kinase